jgi:uncharacterized damage-inducible protein DinB
MFSKTQFQSLYVYHWHTNQTLLTCAARLSEADYLAQPGYGHGSVHDLLFHTLSTLYGWRLALEAGHQPPPLKATDFPDLKTIRAGYKAEQLGWKMLIDSLSGEMIEGSVSLTTLGGRRVDFPRWRILQHLILHGMQHHTEVAHLLTAKGQSPGDIDFIFFDEPDQNA